MSNINLNISSFPYTDNEDHVKKIQALVINYNSNNNEYLSSHPILALDKSLKTENKQLNKAINELNTKNTELDNKFITFSESYNEILGDTFSNEQLKSDLNKIDENLISAVIKLNKTIYGEDLDNQENNGEIPTESILYKLNNLNSSPTSGNSDIILKLDEEIITINTNYNLNLGTLYIEDNLSTANTFYINDFLIINNRIYIALTQKNSDSIYTKSMFICLDENNTILWCKKVKSTSSTSFVYSPNLLYLNNYIYLCYYTNIVANKKIYLNIEKIDLDGNIITTQGISSLIAEVSEPDIKQPFEMKSYNNEIYLVFKYYISTQYFIHILKFDESLNLLINKCYSLSNGENIKYDVNETGIYVVEGFYNGYIYKFDLNGNFITGKSCGNEKRHNFLNITYKNNLIYIVGYVARTGTTITAYDACIICYDVNLNKIWENIIASDLEEVYNNIFISNKYIYCIGYTKYTSSTEKDLLISKFDMNGKNIWHRLIGNRISALFLNRGKILYLNDILCFISSDNTKHASINFISLTQNAGKINTKTIYKDTIYYNYLNSSFLIDIEFNSLTNISSKLGISTNTQFIFDTVYNNELLITRENF